MACTYPLFRVDVSGRASLLPSFLKQRVKVFSTGSEAIVFGNDERFFADQTAKSIFSEVQIVPCSQCLSCRIARSKEWAVRIMLEASLYPHNYFVTLTYNEESIPRGNFLYSDGRLEENQSNLCKSDVQLFLKRLLERCRQKYKHVGIRRFVCGEYGSVSDRAHYHLILFNMPDLTPELRLLRQRDGVKLYTSASIDAAWRNKNGASLGIHSVGEVTYQSAAYCARYCVKKLTEPTKITRELAERIVDYDGIGIRQPEFIMPSRAPGIARPFYDLHRDEIYAFDKLVFKVRENSSVMQKPPKYFDYLYDLDDPDGMDDIKLSRKHSALASEEYRQAHSDLSWEEYLQVKENLLARRIEKLPRYEV